jgi:hypothetical protein
VSRLPQLRASFLDAAERQAKAPARLASPRRPLPLIALAVLCLLLLAAAALAASGVLRIGSPVPSARRLTPTVGLGIPARGGSRVLAVSFPDPAGGPAWGIRVVHTTRDFLCLQVGRLYRGELGVLGRNGAFGDDGRFHPLPPESVGLASGGHCELNGTYSSNEISGIPESALMPVSGDLGALSQARWVSYGLLGPHAVSVTYSYRGQSRTVPVEPLTGAYLIVLPGIEPGTRGIQAGGSAQPGGQGTGLVNPSGALTAITYRLGSTLCQESVQPRVSNPCPRPRVAPPRPLLAPSLDLNRPIGVRLRRASTPGGYSATVRFTAPYAVPNALSGYSIASPASCHEGTVIDPIDRDIKAGAIVTVPMEGIFANACGSTVTLEVLYSPRDERPFPGPGMVLVGRVSVKRPR